MKMDKSNSKIFQYGEVLHTYGPSLSIDINATDIQNGAGFQSTPSVWRVTTAKERSVIDRCVFQSTPSVWRVTFCKRCQIKIFKFQSTPSVWRVTPACPNHYCHILHFNPHPPCGGWHKIEQHNAVVDEISIHTLRIVSWWNENILA